MRLRGGMELESFRMYLISSVGMLLCGVGVGKWILLRLSMTI